MTTTARGRTRRLLGLGWVLPGLMALILFVYVPLVQNFWFSSVKWNIYTGERQFVGTDNYEKMLNDDRFWTALTNNIAYAVVSIIVQVFFALLLAALVEGLRSTRWRAALRAIYFIPAAISLTVSGLLFYFIYEPRMGLLNAFLGAVGLDGLQTAWLGHESTAIWGIIAMSQWQGFGYSTLLFAVAIQRIPREMYDAAAIDGVGVIGRFRHITVPLVREMTALMVIITISGAFQVFNEVMVMTSGGPNHSSHVLGTWLWQKGFRSEDFGYAASIATVIFVVTLTAGMAQIWLARRKKVEW